MSAGDALRSDEAGSAIDRRARALGESRARELLSAHGTDDMWELATNEGVAVRRSEWDGVDGLRLFGTYADGVITLYDEQIPDLANELGVSESLAVDFVVAHELGHHVLDGGDLDIDAPTTKATRRPAWRRFLSSWLGDRADERALEERAAHWFALALLDDRLPRTIRADRHR
ncbi:ImmA/IrrE family metallo-endopeptidase [Halosolutus gelatinilyticus]|uniref:ImmA/IrrE family metallo-endopeptidase n=1 Tax=Halosolutus gelatinilyticus TaxID=2931975 RepID=UPI001FF37967|nr:hypothetical protein [Halosolutus gelatinilyticus]